jgi:hypothetical protein
LLLQLQTALLGWEAGEAGHTAKAAALARFGKLFQVYPSLPLELVTQVAGQLPQAERQHIVRTVSQADILITSPDKVQLLLALLAQQQPSIFRAAAGQGQRAAVLDPLLACLHLEHVVHGVLQRGSRGYATHHAAVDAGVAQLRVLQLLGADLDLLCMDKGSGLPVTPIVLACTSLASGYDHGPLPGEQQQQPPLLQQDLIMGHNREGCLLNKHGNFRSLIKRRLEVAELLVNSGASLAFRPSTPVMPSALGLAASAGLYPLLECVLPPTLKALGDQSQVAPNKRQLSLAIGFAARAGNVRCLRLLLGAAAGGPASKEARAALSHTTGIFRLYAMKLLLAEGVPVNGRVLGVTAPLHAFISSFCSTKHSVVSLEQSDIHWDLLTSAMSWHLNQCVTSSRLKQLLSRTSNQPPTPRGTVLTSILFLALPGTCRRWRRPCLTCCCPRGRMSTCGGTRDSRRP